VTLGLAVLGGLGLPRVLARIAPPHRAWAAAGVLTAAVGGSVVTSLNLVPAPPVPDAYRRLAALPRGPVVEFPFFNQPLERHRHTEYMLMSIQHWQPLVNGYSDHLPPDVHEDMTELATFPDERAWARVRAHGARYVVVHYRSYEPAEAARIRAVVDGWPSRLRPVVDGDGVALYEVLSLPSRASAASSVSSFLQKQNRTLDRPDAGSR
jgi:hypothetical protein